MFDKTKIGKRIGSGADCTVYLYGNDQVIKFSSFSLILGRMMHEKLLRDYAICKEYLGDYVVETQNISSSSGRRYIEVQEYVRGTEMSIHHASNPFLLNQLRQIASSIEKMREDGYHPIDLIGQNGILRPHLSNIIVDEANKLKIIDATLLESRSVGIIGLLAEPLMKIGRIRQEHVLKRFLAHN